MTKSSGQVIVCAANMATANIAIQLGSSPSSSSSSLDKAVAQVQADSGIPAADKARLDADISQRRLSLPSLQLLASHPDKQPNKTSVHAPLREHSRPSRCTGSRSSSSSSSSSLVFPSFQEAPEAPSLELQKRREYLKLRQEAREYNKMVFGTEQDPRVQEIMNAGNHYASARNQLAISANMVMSVLASFAIAYYAGKSMKASQTTVSPCSSVPYFFFLFLFLILLLLLLLSCDARSRFLS